MFLEDIMYAKLAKRFLDGHQIVQHLPLCDCMTRDMQG